MKSPAILQIILPYLSPKLVAHIHNTSNCMYTQSHTLLQHDSNVESKILWYSARTVCVCPCVCKASSWTVTELKGQVKKYVYICMQAVADEHTAEGVHARCWHMFGIGGRSRADDVVD